MCDKLDVDVWEVIDAAATKPFGFMPFYPGSGLGGHCIPIDPHYLAWKMKTLDYNARFIELAGEINSSMPEYVPYIPEFSEENMTLSSVELSEELLESMDCTILVTNHSSYNYQWLVDHSNIFVDTRNVTKDFANSQKVVVKL